MPKRDEVVREWHHVDATDRSLGRLAVEIAVLLRGKHKPQFANHVDVGDFVVVTNVDDLAISHDKAQSKVYSRHSGYPGGLRRSTLGAEMIKQPEEVLRRAVRGMLPKNRLSRKQLSKLKIYVGPDHPHAAQLNGTPGAPNSRKRLKTERATKRGSKSTSKPITKAVDADDAKSVDEPDEVMSSGSQDESAIAEDSKENS